MARRMDVKVVGRAKQKLEHVPQNQASQEVATQIHFALLGIESGYIKPQVEPGDCGIHEVPLGGRRVAKLCMRRPTERLVEVHLIRVVKRCE